MSALIFALLLGLFGFFFIVGFMLWLTNKSATAAITNHFRDAEYILDHHKPPVNWLSADNHITPEHLERLDRLIVYFENSPLVADQETRTLLIDSLTEERTSWQQTVNPSNNNQ